MVPLQPKQLILVSSQLLLNSFEVSSLLSSSKSYCYQRVVDSTQLFGHSRT